LFIPSRLGQGFRESLRQSYDYTTSFFAAVFLCRCHRSRHNIWVAVDESWANVLDSIQYLRQSTTFYLICVPFGVYVGLFNAFSTLINQILEPYGFTEDQAGICGAVLIIAGLLFAAISSVLVSLLHPRPYSLAMIVFVPLLVIGYIIFTFLPQLGHIVPLDIISGLIGAASFSLVPIALEFLTETLPKEAARSRGGAYRRTSDALPELASVICWSLGQVMGGVLIIAMGNMRGLWPRDPPRNLKSALVLQAVLACVVAIPVLIEAVRYNSQIRRGIFS